MTFRQGRWARRWRRRVGFVEQTGKEAAIGALKHLQAILRGEAGGTTVAAAMSGIEFVLKKICGSSTST
jgi:carbamate kinase